MTGSDAVTRFIERFLYPNVFLVTGGACAFMIDSIGQSETVTFVPFQHEQAAAMAADAIWRTKGQVGVTMATSGPGATNLITGIACSWFDSIPSFHITGQVNQSESKEYLKVDVRQAGFQETNIVEMVKPITKYAVQIKSIDHLLDELPKSLEIALSGRKGPVLIDIPMNIQKEQLTEIQITKMNNWAIKHDKKTKDCGEVAEIIETFFKNSQRPLVLVGAGCALNGTSDYVEQWCLQNKIPFVASWGAMPYLDRSVDLYQGSIGVYGSRHANFCIQSADKILVLGSRLDNRQRTGNPFGFAPFAELLVFDIDNEELKKYQEQRNYKTLLFDLSKIESVLREVKVLSNKDWLDLIELNKGLFATGFRESISENDLNPYFAVQEIQSKFEPNSVVVSDCGANLCWVYQSYLPDTSFLFTAGGNSPMGYSLPAAIGAAICNPEKSIYCFIGDGGLQMNIQELQTVVSNNLNIKIIIQNNYGYGIIKQFQDAYFEGRYFATGEGYSLPDFGKIANAYGLKFTSVSNMEELRSFQFSNKFEILNLTLNENSLITPKTEMDRFIHDQFPYLADGLIQRLPFNYPERPSELKNLTNPTV